jgi:multisubunit Na+/H+ antiporter MnhB subunit
MINKESLKIFTEKLFLVLNNTLPGIFILEVVFNRGFFSNTPKTFYEFILLLLWAFIFSIPYNIKDVFSMDDFYENIKKTAHEKNLFTEELEKKYKKHVKRQKKENEQIDSVVHFVGLNVFLLISYIVYKYLESHYLYNTFWNINKTILIYLNMIVIVFPIIYFASHAIQNILINRFVKQVFKNQNTI